jgi:hypothetical protein
VFLIVNDPGRETCGEEGTAAAVPGVVLSRVVALKPLDGAREVFCSGVDDGVVVRAHQAVRVETDSETGGSTAEEREEHAPIRRVAKEHRLVHASSGYVEIPVGKLGAEDARHGPRLGAEAAISPRH